MLYCVALLYTLPLFGYFRRSSDFFIVALLIIFVFFGYIFRKRVSYISCPLKDYEGRSSKGSFIGIVHLILSFGLAAICFFPISNWKETEELLNNDLIRISSFILLLIVWLFIIGLLIEEFLVRTDKEYKKWKHDYLNKK